jgi:spermidine synthase
MIGLGGGSLAKFFHRRLRGLRTHVVETDERVITTARSLFHVPADDARLTIEHGDGVQALAPECCDLLVVDGFEDEATPSALVSQEFFDAAWCALEEPGALVMNIMNDDRLLDRHLQRIERAFGGAVLAFHALRDPNVVVLGLKGAPASVEWPALRARAAALERRYGLPFPRYVERLRSMNQWTAAALTIRPQAAP